MLGVGSAATLAPYLSCVVTDRISRRIFDFQAHPHSLSNLFNVSQ